MATGPGALRPAAAAHLLPGLSALKSYPSHGAVTTANAPKAKPISKLLSLAPRRLNVLWAMLRDGTTYAPVPVPTSRLDP